MKKLFFVLILLAIMPFVSLAQVPSDAFFQKYTNQEGVDITSIAGFMLKPFADSYTSSLTLNDADKKKLTEYINSISSITLAQAPSGSAKAKELVSEIDKISKNKKYTELFSTKSNGATIKILSHQDGNNITEILGFGGDGKESMAVSLQGTFTEAMIKDVLSRAVEMMNQNK